MIVHSKSLVFSELDIHISFSTSRNAGFIPLEITTARLTGNVKDRARDELAGRTGETDSEMSGAE
jgi:hypothetical protein